jgi:predicted anti-sigma-YlaC factor YlaD
MELVRDEACERARSWISLRLDDELSELEVRLLRAHVEGCHLCRTFENDVIATTAMIRKDPRLTFTCPATFSVSRPRRVVGAPIWAIAATAIVAIGLAISTPGGKRNQFVPYAVTHVSPDSRGVDEVRALKRAEAAVTRTASRPVTSFGYARHFELSDS